jgi:hypothetical protein
MMISKGDGKMIDAKELEEAINAIELTPKGRYADILIAAARAHLATLPRYLNVEVVRWLIVRPSGVGTSLYDEEGTARCACPDGWQVVKLTGTARVRV